MNDKTPAGTPERIGRFDVVRALGSGGGGRVRLVRDPVHGGDLRALKLGLQTEDDVEGADSVGRIWDEARALGALRHPGIPRVFEVGRMDDGTPWVLMEFVEAPTQPLDPLQFALGALDVLSYLHRHGWIHHDVKPGNLLAGKDGRVVLLDYGLAARAHSHVLPRGTLPFVAPEVLGGRPADGRSDLWSLGAALLRRFSGKDFAPNAQIGPDDVPDDAPLPVAWLRRILRGDPARRFDDTETAYRALCGEAGIPARPLSRLPLPHSPVPVGREPELAGLSKRLDVLRRGLWGESAAGARTVLGMALLHGESGVGKSVVLSEFRLRALAAGWTVYLASCSAERDSPVPALGGVLQSILDATPADSPAVKRRGAAVASLLAARMDRDAPETAARFLIERAIEGDGIVILVEDLQSASAMTLRLLTTIARAVADSVTRGQPPRLFVAGTLMEGAPLPEEVAETLSALETEGVLFRIPLRPLSPGDLTELVRAVLGHSAPGDRIADVLRAHGGALPLAAEELLDRLVEARGLRYEIGRWLLDERATPSLPQNLLAAVRARLERLPTGELRAVQLLATYERPLPLAWAGRLLGADARTILSTLRRRGLVVPALEGRAAALPHAVVVQAAISLLPRKAWPKLHDRVAASMPRNDPAVAVRRAFHVARGTDPDVGFHAATKAARRLRAEGEPGRAADFVRQALRLLSGADPRIPLVRRSLADLLVISGRPEAAANVYRDLIGDEEDPFTRTRLQVGLAEALDGSGLSGDVVETCEAALASLDESGLPADDPEAVGLRLSLLARVAGALRATGDLPAAMDRIKEALPLAGVGMAAERAALLSLLGNIFVQVGDLPRALQFHESCLAASRSAGSRRNVATAFHNMGVVHAHLGDPDEAGRLYRRALRLSMRAKDLPGVAQTLGNLANLRAEAGDFHAAEQLQIKSLALRRRIGDIQGVAITQGNIAGLKRALGRLGSALALWKAAVQQLRRIGDAEGEVQFLIQAAAIHLFACDHAGAGPLIQRALQRAQGASLRGLEARAELLFGRIERREAPMSEEWGKRLARARQLFEHVGDRAGLAEAHLETALAERDVGRREVALREWRAAKALVGHGASPDLRARVDLVRGRLAGDRDPDREAVAALQRFYAYTRSSGRRDYRVAAAIALARARTALDEPGEAARLLEEAQRLEEDLAASLPPTLRRSREVGPPRLLLETLRREIEDRIADQEASASETHEAMEQDRLLKLLEINKRLNQATDMRALLGGIMDAATEMTGAERGFLILLSKQDSKQKIQFQVARNFRREEVRKPELKVSSSIVKRVIKSGSAILTDNATEDARFSEFKSVDRLELKSIVSIPFKVGEEIIGALYLDNPAQKGVFGPGDLQFLQALGDQAAIAIRNLRQSQQMSALNVQLEENLEKKSAQLEQASRALADRATKYPYDEIVGRSGAMREMLLLVDKVVDTEVPVLIQGESGTGKELVARAIHVHGRRAKGPFVAVNCGAIAATLMESELFGYVKGAFTGAHENKKGLFSAANGGTIFLDEIGEMDMDMQKKLLRVLQEQEVRAVGAKTTERIDVRVIAATNRNLREDMQAGKFRQDLFYRVAVINVDLPPLRDRSDDIPDLVEHFVRHAAEQLGLTAKEIDEDAMEALTAFEWPGNVRQLDNEVKKALTLSDERVLLSDLSPDVQGDLSEPEPQLVASSSEGRTLKENLEKTEKRLIERALGKTGGNQTRAARELGISRVWLRKKMEKYGLLPGRS